MRWLQLFLLSSIALHAGEARQWTLTGVAPFNAELVAADGLRATLLVPGRGKTVIPFAQMSPADAAFVHEWRAGNRAAPLIDPERLAPWPAEAIAENIDARMVSEDATDYNNAGGNGGSGGTYNGSTHRMLLLLPNLGIKPGTNGLALDFQRNIFVLKHEVTHQILGRWQDYLPRWLNEGFCECMAAAPYTRGRYSFQGLNASMHDYVLKWRANPNQRELKIVPPERLMALDAEQWNAEVASQSAYELYNSAALLTHYFIHADGGGDGANLAAFFDDIRRGTSASEAETQRLLRGRTRESLSIELQSYGRKLGLTLKFDAPKPVQVGR